MKNHFFIFSALIVFSSLFYACQEEEGVLLNSNDSSNGNVVMFSWENIPQSNDTSKFEFISMEDMAQDNTIRPTIGNKSIDDDILSNKGNYYQYAPIIDGGYAMIGGYIYKTFIIGDQRWFLEDYKDAGLVNSCSDVWERAVLGTLPSVFTSDTAWYFYYDAALLANGTTTTMDFNAPAGLTPTTPWKLPNRYDLIHLWYMLGYDQYKMTELFYENEHKGVIVAEYDDTSTPPKMNPQSVYFPDYSFFWIENDYSNVHYTLYGFKEGGAYGYFNPGYLPPEYLYAPFRLMQYITPIDTIPVN